MPAGARLVGLQELHDPREAHRRRRQPPVEGDDAVEAGPERGLDRGALRPGHVAAEHLGLEAQLVAAADHADAVVRVGREISTTSALVAWMARMIGLKSVVVSG